MSIKPYDQKSPGPDFNYVLWGISFFKFVKMGSKEAFILANRSIER